MPCCAGATYLVWIGARLLWACWRGHANAAALTGASAWGAVREGAIDNATNPRPLLFMFAFLPQLVDPAAGPARVQLLVLGLLQKLCGVLVLDSAALASDAVAGAGRPATPASLTWQEQLTGVVMVALGVRLALVGDTPRPARGLGQQRTRHAAASPGPIPPAWTQHSLLPSGSRQ